MSTRTVSEILAGTSPAGRRTFQPVRRNSYHAGEREHRIWRPLAKTRQETRLEIARRIKAAADFDRERRLPGNRNGPLGHIGVDVLRLLYNLMDFKTGRLDPCIDTICAKLRRSRAAVVSALARLRDRGFLNWIRRTEPIDNDGAGPQVRQISNAYGFGLPPAAEAAVRRMQARPPVPADEADRLQRAREELEAMLATLPLDEFVRATVDDGPFATALARLGAAIESRSASSLNGQNPGQSENI